MNPALREYVTLLAAMLAGAGALLAALSQDWTQAGAGAGDAPLAAASLTGTELSPLAGALAMAALAAPAAVLATRGWARRAVGCAVVLFGLGAAADLWAATRAERLGRLLESSGHAGEAALHPVWPWIAAAGALALVLGGAVTAARGASWPTLGGRYDAPGETAGRPRAAAGDDPAALWEALSQGEDPTAARTPRPPPAE